MVKQIGGFEKMNLLPQIFRAIRKKGYKIPTPIQRRAIPVAITGQDIIAVARTGSGKTAAFLIPILNRLAQHCTTVGVRVVIVAPTRELAQQTYRFTKDLTKFMNIRTALLTGGDALKNEFDKLAANPDILVATPGRLMHLIVEMQYSLSTVEMVVLDEADRLIEMGMIEQVSVALKAMDHHQRQTLCFSATLPEQLTQFSKTGLNNPVLVKLDQEHKLPKELTIDNFVVRTDDKDCALFHLLFTVAKANTDNVLTIVFTASRHHVDYLETLLQASGLKAAGLHGHMDQPARDEVMTAFRKRKLKVLIVTDVASRGIDIPLLDYVINYDFPCTPKLFIHRSGRAARAGMPGKCYSLITPLELPYLVDTALYLGRDGENNIGTFSDEVLRNEHEELKLLKEKINKEDIEKKLLTLNNSHKLYVRTRPSSSIASVKRSKELKYGIHPMFKHASNDLEEFTQKIKSFRPTMNILEVSAKLTGNTELAQKIKANKLKFKQITEHKKALEEKEQEIDDLDDAVKDADISFSHKPIEFSVVQKKNRPESFQKRSREDEETPGPTKKLKRGKQADFRSQSFLSYESTGFFDRDRELSQLTFQAPMDDDMGLAPKRQKMVWDNKKKRYINEEKPKSIANQFRPDHKANKIYKLWTKETKKRIQKSGEQEDPKNLARRTGYSQRDGDMKTNEEIIKQRKKKFSHVQKNKHKIISKQKYQDKNKRKIEKHMRPTRSQMKVKVRK